MVVGDEQHNMLLIRCTIEKRLNASDAKKAQIDSTNLEVGHYFINIPRSSKTSRPKSLTPQADLEP